MKNVRLVIVVFFFFLFSSYSFAQRYWIATTASNWNNTANWSTSATGSGGSSVPGSGDQVFFTANRQGNCNLDVTPTVNGISVSSYTSTIDLAGNTLTTTGTNTFAAGTITDSGGGGALQINGTSTTTFSGTLVNVPVTGTTGRIFLNGSTFGATFSLIKTANNGDNSTGGNTFNGSVTITNASSGAFQLSATNPDIFNGTFTINQNGSGSIDIARVAANTQLNGNISINYNATGNIAFGSGGGTSSLASGSTISVMSFGASGCGNLSLARFTQLGSTSQTIVLGGSNASSTLTLGPASTFNGSVTASASVFALNASTFINPVNFTQTGNSVVGTSRGGNLFQNTVSISNTGDSDIYLGSNVADAGDIFNGDATFYALGGGRIRVGQSNAGNRFNGNATFYSSGAVDINANRIQISRLANSEVTFNGSATFINNGVGSDVHISYDAGSSTTFNGPVTITSTGTASGNTPREVFIGVDGNVIFNNNLTLNNTTPDGIQMNNGTGNVTMAAGYTVSIGATGFTDGTLELSNFTQAGSALMSLALTGNALLQAGPNLSIGGDVVFSAPRVYLHGGAYARTTSIEKTGAVDDYGRGGNTFTGTTSILNSGSGSFVLANTNPDVFNGAVTFTNTGSGYIFPAYNSPANQFNENIIVNSIGSSLGIRFSHNNSGTSILAANKTIIVGVVGYTTGELRLRRFTQLGSTTQNLTLTNSAQLYIGPTASFGGNVDFRSPQLFFDATLFSGTAFLEKTGDVDNGSNGNSTFISAATIKNSGTGLLRTNGNNTFGGATSLINTGSNYLLLELTTGSNYNGDLTLLNAGTSTIRMAYLGASNFNGNILVNNTSGDGIYFCERVSATATLANGKTISVGATGFTTGELRLNRFTQNGSASQSLTLAGTSILTLGPTSSFGGNVDFRSPQLFFEATLFSGNTFLEKTGAVDNLSNGNNTFSSTATIKNSGTGFFRTNGNNTFGGATSLINTSSSDLLLELVTGSTYNGDVILTNSGTSTLRAVYRGTSNFNGNILVNNTSGNGIYFSEHASGSSTLASGKTITVGAGGFATGTLWLQRFTQNSNAAQNIVLTGAGTFITGSASVWNGSIAVSSPSLFLNGNVFNGITNSFVKTGTTIDNSNGGNTFATGTTSTFTNAGSGIFRLANSTGDVFSGSAVFLQSSGTLNPAYNSVTTFAGDITTNGAAVITFGAGTGSSRFTGADNQSVSKAGGVSPVFTRLIMNKTSGVVTLNTDISITSTGTFTSGVMNATATNYVNFANGATSIINALGNNSSYVEGPVRKTGTNLFSFPTGNAGIFRPISISAPSASTVFTAQYFKTTPPYGGVSTYDPSFVTLSGCEYWILDRTSGAGTANVTLSWVASDCIAPYITNPSTLRVARWNTTSWVNQGNGGVTGSASSGTVTTSAAVASFSPFTIASTTLSNPLPIELVDFTAILNDDHISLNWITESELNNDFFSIERSTDGMEFSVLGTVKGAGTTSHRKEYAFMDSDLSSSLFYYRLRQTDFDKKSTYSKVIRVALTETTELIAYPNPTPKGIMRINSKGDFALYNNLGQMVVKVIDSNQMDVSQLPSGIYTLRSSNGMHFRLVIE